MRRIVLLVAAVPVVAGIVAALNRTSARANAAPVLQSVKDVRGATPYAEIENEAAPRLIVDSPLPDPLALTPSIVWIQWRVENVHILPAFGKGALNVSPRVGHLHIQVDDLPWGWADASDINTTGVAGLPPGPHKIRIDLGERQPWGLSQSVQDGNVHNTCPGEIADGRRTTWRMIRTWRT